MHRYAHTTPHTHMHNCTCAHTHTHTHTHAHRLKTRDVVMTFFESVDSLKDGLVFFCEASYKIGLFEVVAKLLRHLYLCHMYTHTHAPTHYVYAKTYGVTTMTWLPLLSGLFCEKSPTTIGFLQKRPANLGLFESIMCFI